jgi:hypothetical protein
MMDLLLLTEFALENDPETSKLCIGNRSTISPIRSAMDVAVQTVGQHARPIR